ncbi:MAG: SMP-30/gluconolactonase/LRE family protein, partial [Paracoccaceae bacterium]
SDTGASHVPDGPKALYRFDCDASGPLSEKPRFFTECIAGLFDGFRIDTDNRIWTSARDGVHCYAPDGTLIGKIQIPEIVSNLCFGGPRLNRLFITGTTSLYSVYLAINGKTI